jgi:tRNA(fMet)-specific endonuclease VapC
LIYLLDTNTCIQYLTGRNPNVARRLQRQKRSDIVLCDIVKLELYYGAKSQRQQRNLELLKEFFQEFVSLPFDGNIAKICGQIRAQLSALGTPIGPLDLQIAAIASYHNLILVTHNTREFSRVDSLKLEDWEVNNLVE